MTDPLIPFSRRDFIARSTLALAAATLPSIADNASTAPATTNDTSTAATDSPTPTQILLTTKPPFTLPNLPYPANALEPHFDTKTMEIHHGKHHATYVTQLNAALEASPEHSQKTLELLLSSLPSIQDPTLQNRIRNHGGGHWNHTFFWNTLTPPSNPTEPSEELAVAIQTEFKDLENFKKTFTTAAMSLFGSGWTWLILKQGKLSIVNTANQDNPLMLGTLPPTALGHPLLALDVWEHAYYLKHQNLRANYISAFFNLINWQLVSQRFSNFS